MNHALDFLMWLYSILASAKSTFKAIVFKKLFNLMFSNCILHATVLRDRETEILIFYKFGKEIIFELLSGGKFEFTFGLLELFPGILGPSVL